MQLFTDFSFFLCVAIATIPAVILGIKEKPIKYYGFLVTLFFVAMAMYSKPVALCFLIGFCVYDYLVIQVYLKVRKKFGRNAGWYWCFLLLSLAPLIGNKLLTLTANPLHILAFLGISYMTFKGTQIVIEIYDGIIEEVPAFEFFYLMLYFPAITSGPIDRSRRFSEDINRHIPKDEYLEMVGTGLFKICLGMFYKMVLATAFYQGVLWLGRAKGIQAALCYMYSYGFYLFFDFAGYSLMAIGVSYLFGIVTPENFNKPFISKDIKEFWDRWHITLSHWFRDFIFSRLMMRFIKHKCFKSKLTGASVGFIINMGIMGLWHGLTIYYIMYGLYHGVLLAVTEVYQKKSKFYKKHKKDKWFMFVEWFITFNLVMFGFFIFSGRFTYLIGLS
jgi:membrane protein involved in D-alanine export